MRIIHRLLPVLIAVAAAAVAPPRAVAQPVVSDVEPLASDRPEAWAIRYFTSTTLLTGLGAPRDLRPGGVVIGAEVVWLPSLSTAERRVGFDGTKVEDLNKAPGFVRPRVTVGLPARFAATFAFIPPVEAFGVKSSLYAAALERPLHEAESWAIVGRLFGQTGTSTGAFTCTARDAAFTPGSPENEFGCLAASSDEATLRYVGGEVGAAGRLGRRLSPHAGFAVHSFHNRFAANARRLDFFDKDQRTEFLDRSVQRSSGTTISLTAGVGLRLASRLELAVDALYAPLAVRRTFGAPRQNDPLVNVKALLRYRLR